MTQENATEGGGAAPSNASAFIERLHDLAVRTQNPAYLWLALEQLLAAGGCEEELQPDSVTIPGWMVPYLLDAASRINCLAAGVDYRITPPSIDLGTFVTDGEPWPLEKILRSPEMQKSAAMTAIDPTNAVKAVPQALGFVQGTKNSFKEVQADLSKMQEAKFYEGVTAAGVAAKIAVAAIAEGSDAKAQSDRQVYDRIRQGSKLL